MISPRNPRALSAGDFTKKKLAKKDNTQRTKLIDFGDCTIPDSVRLKMRGVIVMRCRTLATWAVSPPPQGGGVEERWWTTISEAEKQYLTAVLGLNEDSDKSILRKSRARK